MNLIHFNCKIIFRSNTNCVIQFNYNNNIYQSLLHALEYNHIPMNYQCRSGYCGICRASLIEGCVKYNQEPLVYTQLQEVLTCCCMPTKNIILKI